MLITKNKLKHYGWSLFGAVGVITFWAGIWEGIGGLPYLENPLISFIIGMAMLTFSGLVYKQFDPLEEVEGEINAVLEKVEAHPQKHQFEIKYFDKMKNKEISFQGRSLKGVEKNILTFIDQTGKEIYVPAHRLTKIIHQKKAYWEAGKR